MGFALTLALLLLANPLDPTNFLHVELGDKTVAILDRADYTLPVDGVPVADDYRLQKLIDAVAKEAYVAPINATINAHGAIVPEKKGRKLDEAAFLERFYQYYYGQGAATMQVSYQEVYPKVDKALLSQVRKKVIGQYATYFNSRNKNRSHNIRLASQAINNYVVLPGEIFSFNKVVGQRTKEKGYLQAPIIVRGELSEGIGGGICQVSSTLFNAVDKAGLHIMQRYSHSRNVAYVPPGRDATVSWHGPDFVFQNKYAYPVMIRAIAGNGTMYVTVNSFPEIEYEPRHVPSVRQNTPEEGPASPETITEPTLP
ncbi:VanW family protein [Brevibacillus agri]|uniref:VanW family protein n=1 Tax=Brevibacillus agri TaxID=51101 RepID=UPI0024BFD885|nr:VanW family protein [Brevibacillus agri]MED4572431.1 VanW family protein [Brevibacillus agri]WHX32017.1 VanW family protein [Brevibacillus agri]